MIPISDDNPTRHFPLITVAVIAACVAVFAWQMTLPGDGAVAFFAFGLVPAELLYGAKVVPGIDIPEPFTLVTHMFLHGDLLHLGGNMLYLWVFGNNVEDAMGRGRFVVFYLLCGFAAAGAQMFVPMMPVFGGTELIGERAMEAMSIPMVGASGAISGMLGAYLLLYPLAKIITVIPLGIILYPVKLPAMVVLGIYMAIQIVSALLSDPSEPGVAWWAHIGGFVAGMALIGFFKRGDVPFLAPARHTTTRLEEQLKGPWERRRKVDHGGPWG